MASGVKQNLHAQLVHTAVALLMAKRPAITPPPQLFSKPPSRHASPHAQQAAKPSASCGGAEAGAPAAASNEPSRQQARAA